MPLIVRDTIAKSFIAAAQERSDAIALRSKSLGIWHPVTWAQWQNKTAALVNALNTMGFGPGDVASILANTVVEWVYADVAILCAGGISSGIYPTDSPKQIAYLINDSKTKIIFVEDDEQLDKVLQVRDQCPTLEKIIIFDMEGLHRLDDPMTVSLESCLNLGSQIHATDPSAWQAHIDSRRPEDIAILVYTSGTTGPPKGAIHTNKSVAAQMSNSDALFKTSGDRRERLVFLPLCHIAERIGGYYNAIATGAVMNFGESPETFADNLREVQPTEFLAVPRVWEKFYSSAMIGLKDATQVEKIAYKAAIGLGYRMADHILDSTKPSAALRCANWVGQHFVLGNIRRLIGLDRAQYIFTGAAPISPDLVKWYLALGLRMHELYGQTECCGLATAMPRDAIKLGTVGKSVPWGEVKTSADGEILIRGDFVFAGYLNLPEKTAETLDADGWLHTGDVGYIDSQGFVKITDRMKDIIITAGGKNITPSEIENQLKFSPYIADAVVVGDKRPYLTCLIMIDQENVEKFAQDRNVPFTNYASLCRTPEVRTLIWSEIERVNKEFARVEGIKKFYLIEAQLTAEDEELTPTMKLKRSFVNKKYAPEIQAMYS